jgi:pyruvate kinase
VLVVKYSKLYRKRTKIVCTIGPATAATAVIEKMIKSGMNIARLNLSHGAHREHGRYIKRVRRIGNRLGTNVGILIDLPGPKYRIGKLKGGCLLLEKGARVILTVRPVEGDITTIPVNFPDLATKVRVGNTVLIDDGAIQLRVLGKNETEISCRVMVGGKLTDERGLVVPGMSVSGPYVTDALREHLMFALREQPDYLALSFVHSAEDVAQVRAVLSENGLDIPVIAKIEIGAAVVNFDDILDVSDGVMVARGDLGVDIPLERVPLVQKEIIRKCNRAGKPVITATQMLQSMVDAASPTRAEVTDVANAIFDGTDAVMLSAETSIGKYPVTAVRMMSRIAQAVEGKLDYKQLLAERNSWLKPKTDELISYSACLMAQNLGASVIVAFTESGSTAGRVSKYRPKAPILAMTSNSIVSGRLLLHWGVYPHQLAALSSLDSLFTSAAELSEGLGLAKSGDLIVITGGIPIGVAGSTNLLKVETVP